MAELVVEVVHHDGGMTLVLAGALTAPWADLLVAKGRPAASRYDRDQITFDCRALVSIDAEGIQALRRTLQSAGPEGRPALAGVPAAVARALEDAGLTDELDLRPTTAA